MTKEEVKLKLVNKLAQNATYDKELDEWSINFDKAVDIIENIFNAVDIIEG
jgi:hypothetical protein